MSAKLRIFPIFMIVKMNLPYRSVAIFFSISSVSVKLHFLDSLLKLKNILSVVVHWPNKSKIAENIPACFKKYSETRIVLDCTEISLQKSKCLQCRLKTYSHYKSNHTFKFFIGILPTGLITYVSNV